ncbi:MAG: LysM peptidoglycan-binding domain-containing protein [Opitutales bacterium]|nr:LysM peptidoglycan-binding domain-containing protein [Opitutales bacterium]
MKTKGFFLLGISGFLFAVGLGAQQPTSPPLHVVVADLQQDVSILQQQIRQMRVDMEVMTRENERLRREVEEASRRGAVEHVTVAQLNDAVQASQRRMTDLLARNRTEITNQVASEIESLAEKTERAINALARSVEGRPRVERTVTFSDDYPRSGTSYRVRRGDTLSRIAQQNNSRVDWIRNANRLASDTIFEGQELFIPQAPNP